MKTTTERECNDEPSSYRETLAKIEREKAVLETLKPWFDFADKLALAFPRFAPAIIFSATCNCLFLRVNVDSLADVQPMLTAIVRDRKHPHGRLDYPDESRVTYSYGSRRLMANPELVVNVYLNYGSTACRLEKIGEKTVPVMKIVCERMAA